MSSRAVAVRATANFERNLGEIHSFLSGAGAVTAFDALIARLSELIPMLERFPDLGADFLARAPLSMEGQALFERIAKEAGPKTTIRQLIEGEYIILYAAREDSVFLLSIRHHRQLSFDLAAHWP